MKKFSFQTLDVFTIECFGGNQLAVVLDDNELTTEQMQSIAAEFNYSETFFVCAPEDSCACNRLVDLAETIFYRLLSMIDRSVYPFTLFIHSS